MEYYIHYECPKCDGDVYDRAVNFVEHNGLPVFSLNDFSQYSMTCRNMVWIDIDGDILDDEEASNMPEEEKEKGGVHYTQCGYEFGTGDIEVIGEDDL